MSRARLTLLVLLGAAVLPAWSQTSLSNSPIPNGLTPGTPSVGINPPLNTTSPVGSIGIGGTTTQIMPGAANPTGGVSLPSQPSSLYSSNSAFSSSGGVSSATTSSIPGYTPPGSTSLPGYSTPPGTVSFPGMPSGTPGLSSAPGTLGNSSGTAGTGISGTGLNRTP